jgi:hypothetical protein
MTSSKALHPIRWFLAGALAVPLFHQVVLALFHAAKWTTRAPFSFEPVKPFGVPQLVSLSFWGGLWGILLGLILVRMRPPRPFWTVAILFGAIAPTLVAAFVVAPLKGLPAGGDAKLAIIGLSVNAAWGLGTAALYKLFDRIGR